jgi:hypothetical protein
VVENRPLGQLVDSEVELDAGMHKLQIRYLDDRSSSRIYVYWRLPEMMDRELIPFEALFLPEEGAWWPVP